MNQTHKEWELIIVDDCSTDDTEEVVKKYFRKIKGKNGRKRTVYIKLDHNSGSDTKPKNMGTRAAVGKYLYYLDDDVQLRRHTFKTMMDNIGDNDVVYGDMWIMPQNQPGVAHDFDRQLLMLKNYIDTSSALVKKQAVFDVGGWDETLPKFVDWNLWVRMAKAGKSFKRVHELTFNYTLHKNSKSMLVETDVYEHPKLGTLFYPTFSPAGCYIKVPYLTDLFDPKVAIFTLHYDRPKYSKDSYTEMAATSGYPFDWYCADNGGKDTTGRLLKSKARLWKRYGKNVGITKSSNDMIQFILNDKEHDIIIKIDNDVEFQTYDWLKDIVDMWKRNNMIYISPYVEGLYHNPGGSVRVGNGMVGDEYVEVTNHVGGIFAAVSAKAYESFRWEDDHLHGNQDLEASHAFRLKGYMPCYYPKHRICHRDSTLGQQEKHKRYFKRRVHEKKV